MNENSGTRKKRRVSQSVAAIFIFFLASVGFSQEIDTTQAASDPIFGIHIGAGTVSGGRVGVQAKVSNYFSFEFSYGFDVRGFIGLVDADDRVGFGINWYPDRRMDFAVGLRIVHQSMRGLSYSKNIIAADVGIQPYKKSRVNGFARIGFGVGIRTGDYPNPIYFIPQLDVGLAWNF